MRSNYKIRAHFFIKNISTFSLRYILRLRLKNTMKTGNFYPTITPHFTPHFTPQSSPRFTPWQSKIYKNTRFYAVYA